MPLRRLRPALFVLAVSVAVVIGAVTVARSQARAPQSSDASQQPTFVSGTQAVRVDIHVTRDGEPVNDLRREEVQVFEDGVLQTIQSFERIAFARPGSAPTVTARTLERSRELVADPHARVFVLFLDTRHTGYITGYAGEPGPSAQARFPILKTLERLIGPDDLVAVMTPEMRAADISFDRGIAGLARFESTWTTSLLHPDEGMLRDQKELLYNACYPPGPRSPAPEMIARYREKVALDALDDLVGYVGALRQEPTHVFAITDGWTIFTENPKLMAAPEGPRLPKPPLGGRGRDGVGVITERGTVTLSEATFRECESDLLTLASLDHRDRLRQIATHANASNVSFYPISARGLTTGMLSASSPSFTVSSQNTTSLFRQGLLRGLAEDTGGLAIVNTNNLQDLLQQVMTSTSSYYLASYSSTNSALDGRYRRITVKLKRPDVVVRARYGYVATRPQESRTVQPPDSPGKPDPLRTAFGLLESQVRLAGERAAAPGSDGASRGLPAPETALFRRGASPALPFERTTDPRFRRNERLRLAVQMRGTTPATARLLDRRGGMLTAITQISERPDGSGAVTWTEVDLTLASLAIGDYAIEMTAGDDVHVLAFRIVP